MSHVRVDRGISGRKLSARRLVSLLDNVQKCVTRGSCGGVEAKKGVRPLFRSNDKLKVEENVEGYLDFRGSWTTRASFTLPSRHFHGCRVRFVCSKGE